jgi:aspartyl-tRNA(Asn)/glutamyl-tRNA(Gln) amidotransferase subunit A
MPNDAAPRTTDLHFLTIAEAASLIERRQLSPVALTRAFLDRIAAIDPQLNAYLLVTAEQALDQARIAEAEIMAGNEDVRDGITRHERREVLTQGHERHRLRRLLLNPMVDSRAFRRIDLRRPSSA